MPLWRGRRGKKIKDLPHDAFVAELPGAAIAALGRHPAVKFIAPDAVMINADAVDSSNLATLYPSAIDAPSLWSSSGSDSSVTSKGVAVAVLDTGIAGRSVWNSASGKSRIVKQVKFNSTTSNLNDGYGHGTHVAGIIAGASADPLKGKYIGIAPEATALARELGLTGARLKQVRQAGLLHDIGKIAISEQILHKPSKLTDEEYAAIKTHVTIGAELLEPSQGLRHLAPFVRYHHERWDGRGYPAGLRGEDIPLEARILNVCDSVEAMASDRPHHKGMTLSEIIAEVKRNAGTQFDPVVAEVFIRLVEREGQQFIVNSAREVDRKQAGQSEVLCDADEFHFQPRGNAFPKGHAAIADVGHAQVALVGTQGEPALQHAALWHAFCSDRPGR